MEASNGKKMTEKEKADCLIELNKAKLDHFMQTRTIEFQVNISIWSLIVLTGSFLYDKIRLEGWWSHLLYGFVLLVVIFIHGLWMILIQYSEDKDHDCMNKYQDIIADLIDIEELKNIKDKEPSNLHKCLIKIRDWFNWKGWQWVILEVVMTLVLLIGVWILLSNSSIKEKECRHYHIYTINGSYEAQMCMAINDK